MQVCYPTSQFKVQIQALFIFWNINIKLLLKSHGKFLLTTTALKYLRETEAYSVSMQSVLVLVCKEGGKYPGHTKLSLTIKTFMVTQCYNYKRPSPKSRIHIKIIFSLTTHSFLFNLGRYIVCRYSLKYNRTSCL